MKRSSFVFLFLFFCLNSFGQFYSDGLWEFHDIMRSALDSLDLKKHTEVTFTGTYRNGIKKYKESMHYKFSNDSTLTLYEYGSGYKNRPVLLKRKNGYYFKSDSTGNNIERGLSIETVTDSSGYKIISSETNRKDSSFFWADLVRYTYDPKGKFISEVLFHQNQRDIHTYKYFGDAQTFVEIFYNRTNGLEINKDEDELTTVTTTATKNEIRTSLFTDEKKYFYSGGTDVMENTTEETFVKKYADKELINVEYKKTFTYTSNNQLHTEIDKISLEVKH